ncbi:crossover junction endodeoxyribonuclease RuvC [Anaerobiospirillum thomasii]|uniref:Crossover junction endodeoxyribonuclease RuvC n=1 Tax=Anaerobiospirillum thomasii TaxID=179995 RepID=A0A2X0VA72_9GAMM|nr:crossover junction endodeoxyribonuclease RuvC [Anaerobiospirillum thomasii]SPT70016.1 Crossover junction endodeoxyribonuclease RuvC [Anaerobiospirillum thomasii]
MQLRILGIDPGSRITGYGVIDVNGPVVHYVGSGCIKAGTDVLYKRLHNIFTGVSTLIEQFKPDVFAIEQTFLSKNVQSTVKLSEARASAMVAATVASLEVYEYTPMQIKQAVVGYGAAQKNQVQFMVQKILRLSGTPQTDAADALACALCHGYTYAVSSRMGNDVAVGSSIRGRLRGR